MAEIQTTTGSEYNQQSFLGGMKLLRDDTRLETNEYRIGFNLRNRYDRLDLILSSVEDKKAPYGIKQEMTTLGDYEIIFVSGRAYYKLYTDETWIRINNFHMSSTAPRYWTKAVPVSTTNYVRIAASINDSPNVRGALSLSNIAGASAGNLPGLLVQDNINQPVFIYIDIDGKPASRVTQDFSKWNIIFTNANNTKIAPNGDNREYVPIGSAMEFIDGVLYIASPDGNYILQSVSGRPLDFVRNVTNLLVIKDPFIQLPGGDAYTTAYSVGVGPITCLRAMSDASLFVAAGNANFSVSKNYGNNVPLEFGEFPLIRRFLFNSVCLSDRAIFDTTGDTRFISLGGVRSFNAISQSNNEGRNLPFTANIQLAFSVVDKSNSIVSTIIQSPQYSSCVLYDNFELYAVTTVFGPCIAVYDTINNCWSSFDISQTNGKRIKMFAKIELTTQALFAITEDDKVYRLYCGPGTDAASLRSVSICSNFLYAGSNIKLANPKLEVQLRDFRVILNNITKDCKCSVTPYTNNRKSSIGTISKTITYIPPNNPTTGPLSLSDVDTLLENLYFNMAGCEHGWKTFLIIEWTGGSITQFSGEFADITPVNPLNSR